MKAFVFTLCILFLSQNVIGQKFWSNELKNNPVFIENGGQIKENKLSNQILFSTEIDGIELFFTNKGYFYKIKEYVSMSEQEIEEFEGKHEKKSKKEKDEREKEAEKNRFKKVKSN